MTGNTSSFGRLARALAAGGGDPTAAAAQVRAWGGDAVVERALMAGSGSGGGFLVPEGIAAEFIEVLRPMSAVMSLQPSLAPMEHGNLTTPRVDVGAAGAYLGEGENIGVATMSTGQLRLTAKKLAALVPVSNQLLRFASGAADAVIRDDLAAALSTRADLAFIRGNGTEHSPRGLRYWAPAANVIAANGTVNLANVTEDLGKLVLALEAANVRMIRPGWIFAPRIKHYLATVRDGNGNYAFRDEILARRLWGFPIATTTQIPVNLGGGGDESEVYLADFADVVIGEVPLVSIAASQGSYHDGSTVVSAFSRDETVIRAIIEHDLGMRHVESVAVLTAVTWGG